MPTTHVVSQGECLSSIARKYGFADWRTIYEFPDNADFRASRPNPNVIRPGDVLVIPDREEKRESGGTNQRHKLKVSAKKTFLRIALKDDNGKPYAGKKYTLRIGDLELTGTLTGKGLLDQEIPADAAEAHLEVVLDAKTGSRIALPLLLGHLDPIDELTGVRARLNNLGFFAGAPTALPAEGAPAAAGNGAPNGSDDRLTSAVLAFQHANGLQETGEIDDATKVKLRKMHDGY